MEKTREWMEDVENGRERRKATMKRGRKEKRRKVEVEQRTGWM